MDRFNIPLVAEGLTTYAIERQNGFQRQQPPDGPPWAEQRRIWTDSILQSMARLEGKAPDLALMERYDQELSEAKGRFFIIPAAQDMQRNTILYLRAYLSALEDAGGDRRLQAEVVQQLLEDMASHLHWACTDNGIDRARDDAERVLRRMTARMPVRFTRVLLGGDAGPYWVSGLFPAASATPKASRPPMFMRKPAASIRRSQSGPPSALPSLEETRPLLRGPSTPASTT